MLSIGVESGGYEIGGLPVSTGTLGGVALVADTMSGGPVSVPRVSRADGAGGRVHVACGAVIVALGAVGVGLLVRRHVDPGTGCVALHWVAVRV
jgi:hypothetical protein